MKQVILFIQNWWFLKKKSIQLSAAIKLCNLKQKAFNRRYFVIFDHNDKLISLCRDDIKQLKRMRKIQKGVSHIDLMENSFYYTPLSVNNDKAMTKKDRLERQKTYFEYVNAKRC